MLIKYKECIGSLFIANDYYSSYINFRLFPSLWNTRQSYQSGIMMDQALGKLLEKIVKSFYSETYVLQMSISSLLSSSRGASLFFPVLS